MHEHVARVLYYVHIHLLYASIVGLAAWALTAVRGGSAGAKYWVWVAASLNFALPIGAIVDGLLPSYLGWATPLGTLGALASTLSDGTAGMVLALVWLTGSAAMATRLGARLRAELRAGRARPCDPSFVAGGVPVRFAGHGPAVAGVLRPSISLPRGIDRLLSRPELDAVLLHELTHARRRDNLVRLLHELGLCLLWFHPLVWLAGARLSLYRELSCDDQVIRRARGRDLVSALAKLARSDDALLLQANASSLIRHRLERLAGAPRPPSRARTALVAALFAATLVWGIFATVAHTACCFVHR